MAHKLVWPKVYIFGDSLTQYAFGTEGGWAAVLANEFQRRADVVTRGFSGYNTRQCKALLPYLENDLKDVLIAGIFLGANDANNPTLNPQQAVPLAEYQDNLKEIINKFQSLSNTKFIFLISPPALDEDKWKEICISEGKTYAKDSELVAKYAEKCVETAKEIGIPCINLHAEMLNMKPKETSPWKNLLSDGLHFSAEGGSFVASLLRPVIARVLENHKMSSKELIFPEWSLVSNEEPDTSFKKWLEEFGR